MIKKNILFVVFSFILSINILNSYTAYIKPSIGYGVGKNINLFDINATAYGSIFTENLSIGFLAGYSMLKIANNQDLLKDFSDKNLSINKKSVNLDVINLNLSLKYNYMLNKNISLYAEPFVGVLIGENTYYKTKINNTSPNPQTIKLDVSANYSYGLSVGVIYNKLGLNLSYKNLLINNIYYSTTQNNNNFDEEIKTNVINNHVLNLSVFYFFSYNSKQ